MNIRELARAEALERIPDGYRVLEDSELVTADDLHYVYDEYFQEDKGKGKTWQPVSLVIDKKSGVSKTRAGDYFCCVRKVEVEAGPEMLTSKIIMGDLRKGVERTFDNRRIQAGYEIRPLPPQKTFTIYDLSLTELREYLKELNARAPVSDRLHMKLVELEILYRELLDE